MDKQDRGGLALAKAVEAAYAQGQTEYSWEPMVRVDGHGAPVGKIQDGERGFLLPPGRKGNRTDRSVHRSGF